MFAGPNGSGKSTLKSILPSALLGVYLNPDDIEREICRQGFLELSAFRVASTEEEILGFFRKSELLISAKMDEVVKRLSFADGRLQFVGVRVDSYLASVTVDFLRQKLLEQRTTFTFETVMSHPGKIELLTQAQQLGYRTYLYFIATDDPDINISRVKSRVKMGGHPVPINKIEERYHRSLDLLMAAIRHTNRAYIFDNSGNNQKRTWLAEVTEGKMLEIKTDRIPAWFKRSVLEKAGADYKPM